MKREIICFLAGALIFGSVGVLATEYMAAPNSFPVTVNGNHVELEGYNINDRTYFQLRDIGEKTGVLGVDFQNDTIQITTNGTPVNTPTPSPAPTGDRPEKTIDGLEIEYFNDHGYIWKGFIDQYWFLNGIDYTIGPLVENPTSIYERSTGKTILTDIPCYSDNVTYISLETYYSIILPFIESSQK